MTFTNPQTGLVIEALKDINFTLNKGECLGIAGISGNGQNELFQILSGETLSNNGSIKFRSKEISKLN